MLFESFWRRNLKHCVCVLQESAHKIKIALHLFTTTASEVFKHIWNAQRCIYTLKESWDMIQMIINNVLRYLTLDFSKEIGRLPRWNTVSYSRIVLCVFISISCLNGGESVCVCVCLRRSVSYFFMNCLDLFIYGLVVWLKQYYILYISYFCTAIYYDCEIDMNCIKETSFTCMFWWTIFRCLWGHRCYFVCTLFAIHFMYRAVTYCIWIFQQHIQ